MTITKFYELRDSGKIASKTIFLNDGETVVESFKADGVCFLVESHVDVHKETVKWQELHGFWTERDANEYFVGCIKNNPVIRLA